MASSVLHVVELDHAEPSHAELLATWETSKGRIDRVSFTPAFPSLVALATANGFFQLVDSSSGTFRVYAVLVASVPCDVGPRCMALDAAGCVVGRSGGLPSGLSIVFALAYSSTLCRADVDSGVITELINFDSRPSAVCAEADHVAAGDGRGDVSLWRTSEPDTPLLWTKKQLAGRNQEVTALSIARDAIFAGIADYSVKVLSIRDGALTASLVSEGYAPVRAIAPFAPYTDDIAVATSKGLITVWRPSAAALRASTSTDNAGERRVPKSRLLAPDWTVKTILNSFPVSTASFRNGFLVVGGTDGRLALFTTANITAAETQDDVMNSKDVSYGSRMSSHDASGLKMAVCYDLEHAILSGFVTDDSCLTAVTKAGDVWRWPLSDVLAPPMPEDDDSEPTPQGGASHNNTSYGTGANHDDDHGRFDDVDASADQLAHQHQTAGIYQGYGASPAIEAGVPGSLSTAEGRTNRDTSGSGSAGVNQSPLATYPCPNEGAGSTATDANNDEDAHSFERRNTSGTGSTAAPSGAADHFHADEAEHAGDNGSVFGEGGDDGGQSNDVIVVDMDVATPPDGCLTEVTASSSTRGFRSQNTAAIGGAQRDPKPAGNRWNLSDVPSSVVPVAVATPDATRFAADPTGVNDSAPTPAASGAVVESAHDRSDDVTPRQSAPMPTPPPTGGGGSSSTTAKGNIGGHSGGGVVALPRVDPVEIDGLLAGRRMDPRVARNAADRYDRFVASRLADAAGERDDDDAPHPLGVAAPDGSSRMLRRELRGLMGEHVDPSSGGAAAAQTAVADDAEDPFALALKAFEHNGEHVAEAVPEEAVDRYMAEHKAATEAMAFANPIKPFMKFESDDVVFRAVGLTRPAHERLCDRGRGSESPTASTPARVRDDLAPATVSSGFMRRRDRRFERERRAEGPALTDHLCGDLLVPPAGPAVFFDVYHSEIAPAPERVVPLPAAPTPTVA